MRGMFTASALILAAGGVLAAGQAKGQWSDDFNRADGALGGSWTAYFGTIANFAVAGHRGLHALATHDAVTSTSAAGNYAWYSQTVDLFAAPDAVKYTALLSGLGGTNNLYIKVQSNGNVLYDSIGFYSGQANPNGWAGAEPTFQFIPAFDAGRMQVYFTNSGDTVNLAIDSDLDGIPDQRYTRNGVRAFSAAFGNQFGLGAFGNQPIDNWRVMPGVAPAAPQVTPTYVPFEASATSTMHQVFRSGLWSSPVRIMGVRFAPQAVGTMQTNVAIGLGYTARTPGVASPVGLSAPSGTGGAPNVIGGLYNFYTNPNFSQVFSTIESENFQLAFDSSPGFVYFPGMGNLLMQVNAVTTGAFGPPTSRADGSADSSRTFTSTVFGTSEDYGRAPRVQFIAMPVIPEVLPTPAHVTTNGLPFASGTVRMHQVHHAGTLAPLGDGGKVAIQGIRFAPELTASLTADLDVRMGYTTRAPLGLSLPTGAGGVPNATAPMTQFFVGHVDRTFTAMGPENFQLDLHQRPFVYDPGAGNLLIEANVSGGNDVFVSRTSSGPESSRTIASTAYGNDPTNSTASRIKFVTAPVSEGVFPSPTDGGGLYVPFGRGQHVTQQVFASSLFGTAPVRIASIAYAPEVNGGYSGNFTVRLGYTSRAPNVPPPTGLSAPDAGGEGAPNASLSPMAVFWTGAYAKVIAGAAAGNYQIAFEGDVPFLYNPARGNLLLEVISSVPDTAAHVYVDSWNSATVLSSVSVTSNVYGSGFYVNYAPRVKFTYFKDLYPCVADLTGDGMLDLLDFFGFFGCFDVSSSCADLNSDGTVDLLDFFAFFDSWDVGC